MIARAILLAGSAALLAVPASAGVGGFRLPPSQQGQPSAPPVVGPTDPDNPLASRPSPTPTPTPTAVVTPAPAPPPVIVLPEETPAPRPTPAVRAPAATGAPAPGAAVPPAETSEEPTEFASEPAIFGPLPSTPAPQPVAEEDGSGLPWPWLGGLALLLALLGAGGVWLRRRIAPSGAVVVPEIEKPRVPASLPETPPAGAPSPEPALAATAAPADHPLHITIQPVKLTQTMMNATLSYRLTLTNAGEAPLAGVSVAADLVAAHASLPREALMAFPQTELPEQHALPALAPGETVELKGDLRLPLAQAMPIRQGAALVFVPLARFRAGAQSAEPRCFTLVVGEPSPRGAIQPHRLDLGPRSTHGLAGLAF